MKYLLIMFLLLTGCNDVATVKVYPGTQLDWEECHNLWDLGYHEVNVKKCEKSTKNPKYRIGQKVKVIGYNNNCRAIIQTMWQWNPIKNESMYTVKIYCDKKPMHDKWCENGNLLNCPKKEESELKK